MANLEPNEENTPDYAIMISGHSTLISGETSMQAPAVITSQPTLSNFAYGWRRDSSFVRSLLSDKEVTSFINTESAIACTKESPSTAQRDTKAGFCGLDWQKTVDMCSCMFCVRAVCYHCTDEEEENQRWVDDPCTCWTPLYPTRGCVLRWLILTAVSFCLPCLVCYPPCKLIVLMKNAKAT